MGKHVKDYRSSRRSNLCKDIFLFEVLNIAICHACEQVKHFCGLAIYFQLFWCGFLCKDFSSLKLNIYCFLTISL